MLGTIIYLVVFLLLVNAAGFFGLKILFPKKKRAIHFSRLVYWGADLLFVVFSIIWLVLIRSADMPVHELYRKHFYIAGVFVPIYISKAVFASFYVLHQLKNLLAVITSGVITRPQGISKAILVCRKSRWILRVGLVVALLIFVLVLHGIFIGRHQFEVVKHELWFNDLPHSFDGYRIVHFSDTHLGSFANPEHVEKGLGLINELDADAIMFTGDLINNHINETVPYVQLFYGLRARDGKFSVLGNHDMGDYRRWATIEEQKHCLGELEIFYKQTGFTLLRNASHIVHRGSDSIVVAGVDNWGLPPFSQEGDLGEALDKIRPGMFKLLLSHDPSHWRAEVIPKTSVQLTLSGHTHGMQFGMLNRFVQWSPASWIYAEWQGLYREGQQKIYVNRGFGFLSFPGRVGVSPEITLLILRSSHNKQEDLPLIQLHHD